MAWSPPDSPRHQTHGEPGSGGGACLTMGPGAAARSVMGLRFAEPGNGLETCALGGPVDPVEDWVIGFMLGAVPGLR